MDTLSQDAAGDDWLTINVWSPEPDPGAGLPVMVWIQGGGYQIGMSSLREYDGGRLARDGGVDTRPAVTAYPEESSRLIWQSHTFPVLPLISR
jgi:hypothetical protein